MPTWQAWKGLRASTTLRENKVQLKPQISSCCCIGLGCSGEIDRGRFVSALLLQVAVAG